VNYVVEKNYVVKKTPPQNGGALLKTVTRSRKTAIILSYVRAHPGIRVVFMSNLFY